MNDEQFEEMMDEIFGPEGRTPEERRERIKKALNERDEAEERLMWNDPPPRIPGVDKRTVFFRPNQKIGQMSYRELVFLICFALFINNCLFLIAEFLIYHKL